MKSRRQFRGDPERLRFESTEGLPIFDRPATAPYQKSSATSRQAAEQVTPDIDRRRTLVYCAIAVAGEKGLAGFEIAERTGLSLLSVRPRVSQMLSEGALVATGQTRLNANGFREMVVRAVEAE